MAVGEKGAAMTSIDGLAWEYARIATDATLRGIAFGGGKFVAVGDFGVIATSPDGKSWNLEPNSFFGTLEAVAYGGGRFVAVGEDAFVLSSEDGSLWTLRGWGTTDLRSVAYGNGRFVAVGGEPEQSFPFPRIPARSLVLWSSDGVAWAASSTDVDGVPRVVVYGDGAFLMGVHRSYSGGRDYYKSDNGSDWLYLSEFNQCGDLNCGVYGNGRFSMFSGGPSCLPNVYESSVDGLRWSNKAGSLSSPARGVARGRNRMVVVGGIGSGTFGTINDILVIHDNGDLEKPSSVSGASNYPLLHTGGRFFALNGSAFGILDGRLLTSQDGADWKEPILPVGSTARDIAWGTSGFVAVGQAGKVLISTNGMDWSERTTGASNDFTGIAFGGGKYVGVSPDGGVMQSSDAQQWTFNSLTPVIQLSQVEFAGGMFVALNQLDGSVVISADGMDWRMPSTPPATNLHRIREVDGGVIGFNVDGGVFRSSDGDQWTQVIENLPALRIQDVDYHEGLYVVAQANNYGPGYEWQLLTVRVGEVLIRRNLPSRDPIFSVAIGAESVVGSGIWPTFIVQSDPLTNQGPSIVMEPSATAVASGGEISLKVLAVGSSELAYQWLSNNVALPGETRSSLYISGWTPGATAMMSVTVTNAAGAVISTPARVLFGDAPQLEALPQPTAGVLVRGTPGLNYRIEFSNVGDFDGGWQTLTNIVLSSPEEFVSDPITPEGEGRIYRALLFP
ncbi:MAG: immunoglobulin domain-containing protein [Verrucomicrobiae bacterium]|nr:immunoglobulin domain-containing protein [Verrucomicrobiae bacterium]